MKYKCMIVDDEPLAHDILVHYLSDFTELELKAQFYNTADATLYLEQHTVDILLLDIKMPGEDGLHFLEHLASRPITLMTTAFRDYAIEGFDLGVMDYLVKPIKKVRFQQGIKRAIEFLELTAKNSIITEVPTRSQSTFTIKSGTKSIILELKNITHLQGLKDYTIFYAGDKKFAVKGYIKTIIAKLPENCFTRVHKSFVVANFKIKLIDQNHIEFDQFKIPVGRMYKKAVNEMFK